MIVLQVKLLDTPGFVPEGSGCLSVCLSVMSLYVASIFDLRGLSACQGALHNKATPLVGFSADVMQEGLDLFISLFARVGLHFNATKTKAMIMTSEPVYYRQSSVA